MSILEMSLALIELKRLLYRLSMYSYSSDIYNLFLFNYI